MNCKNLYFETIEHKPPIGKREYAKCEIKNQSNRNFLANRKFINDIYERLTGLRCPNEECFFYNNKSIKIDQCPLYQKV